MARVNNYAVQAQQAKDRFLTYDQQALIEKFHLIYDDTYLYTHLLGRPYRIHRATGDMEYEDKGWQDGNSFNEVMTLFDMLCDSRNDRWISGKWQNMLSFGLQFHQNLQEERRDPVATAIDTHPEIFRAACAAMQAEQIPGGDMGYAIELFEGLKIGMLFWHGDDEFLPRLRFLWDANAKMYIRYETMWFAIGMLQQRLMEQMKELGYHG